jgi:hypothetical protein
MITFVAVLSIVFVSTIDAEPIDRLAKNFLKH